MSNLIIKILGDKYDSVKDEINLIIYNNLKKKTILNNVTNSKTVYSSDTQDFVVLGFSPEQFYDGINFSDLLTGLNDIENVEAILNDDFNQWILDNNIIIPNDPLNVDNPINN